MKRTRIFASIGGAALVASSMAGAATAQDSEDVVAFAIPTSQATYFTAYDNAVKELADELGVEVKFAFAENDAAKQNQQVAELIASGANAVVVAPVDVDASLPGITAYEGAEEPIITSNRFVNGAYGGVAGANPKVHTGFSDFEIGRNLGELMVVACGDKDPCNVIMEQGTIGSSPQIERDRGAFEILDATASVNVIDKQTNDFQQAKAIELTDQLLVKHSSGNIDVIGVHDDASAVGVVTAIERAGRQDEINVVGVGGSMEGVEAIADGRMFGTVWVSPRLDGILALEAAVALLAGEEPAGLIEVEGRPTVPVPIEQVTIDNVADYPGEW
jgi:ABC-type sugar transport system substrate-binding protein